MTEGDWPGTAIGHTTADSITVRGSDLADDLMGRVTFTELTFLLIRGVRPSAAETRLLDAVLVSLADHGLTPTVLAARLTYTGAPESLQGAVAAGLLGAGSVFLGVVEDTARFLYEVLAEAGPEPSPEALAAAAGTAVESRMAAGARIPGLGHPVHRVEDPRTATHLPDRGRDRPARGEPAGAAGGRGSARRAHRAGASHQRRRRGRCARWPTSASRPRSSAASPCSPAPPAWSHTSPRR